MNTRSFIVFVLATVVILAATTAFAVETEMEMEMEMELDAQWSPQDDELFSTDLPPVKVVPEQNPVSVAVYAPPPQPEPEPIAVTVVHEPAPTPVVVHVPTVHDDALEEEISAEEDHYAMNHPVDEPIPVPVAHRVTVVHTTAPVEGFIPVAPQRPTLEEGLQSIYRRARGSAMAAQKQAQAAANANATAAQAQNEAKKARTPRQKREAQLNQTAYEATQILANHNASIAELETQLTKLREAANSYRQRLAKNAEKLKNEVSAAEATRIESLKALAEREAEERTRRIAAREAAERARALRRKAAAEARRRHHDEQVRAILSEAKNRTQAAIKAAKIAHYEAQLTETRRKIRELKLRILREKANALAQQRAKLERELWAARTNADKITSELYRINEEAARTTQSVSAATAALQALVVHPHTGEVVGAVAAAPVVPVAAPIAQPVAVPVNVNAPAYAVPTGQPQLYAPRIVGATENTDSVITVPAGSLNTAVPVVAPQYGYYPGHIFLDNPSQNVTAPAPAAAAAASAAPAVVNQSQKTAQAPSFIEIGLTKADLKLVNAHLDEVQQAITAARETEQRITRALENPKMAEAEFNQIFDSVIETF